MLASGIKSTFKLSDNFLEQYRGLQPAWGFGDLSYFTFKRTYARLMTDGTQEEFVDMCERVVNGTFRIQEKHCKLNGLPWNAHKAQRTAQEMFERMWAFKFLPPGRGLWMMGTEHVDKVGSAALNNCGFVSTEDLPVELGSPFAWAMDMLMLGVGIGFDTKGANKVYISAPEHADPTHLPVGKEGELMDMGDYFIYMIPDTREGWVEAIRLVINSFQKKGSNKHVFLNAAYVRPSGQPIKGFGGISSGPSPLLEAADSIRRILIARDTQLLTSVDITDIFNLIGKCVVAGNVRRSAELAIGDITDIDYVTMKDNRLHEKELNHHRWASNNSVFVNRFTDFSSVIENIALNGEPGLIFLDNARHHGRFKDGYIPEDDDRYDHVAGFNPCAEQQLESYELCCLVETFPHNHKDVEDYLRTLKFAYLYAKTVTLVPTHEERTNRVMMRNRRIGCSISGIQQAINKFGRANFFDSFCDKGYETIKSWDRIYSRWLGIPRSNRMTTVKPSGTTSLLAGALPGVHHSHSKASFRTIRVAANSDLVAQLLAANYWLEFAHTDVDKLERILGAGPAPKSRFVLDYDMDEAKRDATDLCSVDINQDDFAKVILPEFAALGGTLVAYFPVIERDVKKTKFEATIWEQLNTVREMQHYWADNAVSCTITVKKTEVPQLQDAIEYFAPYVKTLSFLPLKDHKYIQAPYQEADEDKVRKYAERLLPLDLSDEKQKAKGTRFCDGDTCEI